MRPRWGHSFSQFPPASSVPREADISLVIGAESAAVFRIGTGTAAILETIIALLVALQSALVLAMEFARGSLVSADVAINPTAKSLKAAAPFERASAVALLGTGSWLQLAVSAVAFAVLHGALGG